MKSFDARLENDLFPKTPAAFNHMVKQTIKDACAQSEAQTATVERSWNTENGQQRLRKSAGNFKRAALIAAASVLAVCIVAVGTILFLARSAKTQPASPALPEVITPLDQPADDFRILDVETTRTQSGEVTFTVHYAASEDGYWYLWNSYPYGGGAGCEGEFSKETSSFSFTVSAEKELNRYDGERGGRVQEWNIYLSSVDLVHSVTSKEGLFDSRYIGDRSYFESIVPDAKLEDYESLSLRILSVEKTQAQTGEVIFTVNYSAAADGYWCFMCYFENGGYPVQRGVFSKGTSSFSFTVSAEEELRRSDGFLGGRSKEWDIDLHSDLGSDQDVRLYDSQHVVDRSYFEKIAADVELDDLEILDVETTQSPSGEVTFTVHYHSSVDGYWYFVCAGMEEQNERWGEFSKGDASFTFTVSAEEELNRTCDDLGKVQEWEIDLSSDDRHHCSGQPLMVDSRIIDRSFFENIVSEQKGN